MEKSARWHEPSLSPEYGHPPNPLNSTDVTLPERLRSLLLSRNKKHPPTTPCPTPDYRYYPIDPPKTAVGNYLAPPRTHSTSAPRRQLNREALESLNQTMGATRFDGPAGQVLERSAGESRRHSTDFRMSSDRMSEEQRDSDVTGVDRKSQGDLIGTRLLALDALKNAQSSGPRRPPQKTPRISYTLRTVPPKRQNRINEQIPSDDQNPPSSQSGIGGLDITPVSAEDDSNETHIHHGLSSSAVDALHHIQDHDHDTRPISDVITANSHLIENKGPASSSEPLKRPASKSGVGDETSSLHQPASDSSVAKSGESTARLPPVPMRESSFRSLHSVPLEEEDVQAPETSLLPKVSSDKVDEVKKRSPISRALSVLSNISSTSGLRGSYRQSIPRDDDIPEVNTHEPQDLGSSTLPTKTTGTPPQLELLEKKLEASLEPANLTARPLQRRGMSIDNLNPKITKTDSTDEASILEKQQQAKASFQKVIVDLESLLKEALHIADRTSREHSEVDADLPKTQGDGYRRLSPATSDEQSSFSVDSEDGESPQGHVVIMEPDDEDLYHAHFKKARHATPFPRSLSITRQQSREPTIDAEIHKDERETSGQEADLRTAIQVARPPEPTTSVDWAFVKRPTLVPMRQPTMPPSLQVPAKEQQHYLIRDQDQTSKAAGHTNASHQRPPVQPRGSSLVLRQRPPQKRIQPSASHLKPSQESVSTSGPYVADFRNTAVSYHPVYRGFNTVAKDTQAKGTSRVADASIDDDVVPEPQPEVQNQDRQGHSHPTRDEVRNGYSLKKRHHFEIRDHHGFSLSRSHRRAPIARDWSPFRKRFVATVTCINTALLGLIIGIYTGEVPAIQYAVADDHHIVILGNVVFFLGLAVTTALFWPLPLLHGRRPYTTAALTILLLLLLPQALSINESRNPYVATYRVGLLVPRAFAGLVMGFANINFKTTLLDLFGSSLQSGNPHQEIINEYDVRRHGGGMGVWLGIWSWCSLGSIGVGFWIGATIISGLQVSWGFYILIVLAAAVLFLNVLTPETRRSAYRRSMAEVRDGDDVSRRIARGEIKMHLYSTGPLWWWEEVWAGHVLCIRMFKQPGFAILALYLGWIYGQVVLVIVLLGALLSKYYFFHPQYVGLSIAIMPLGALLATPFQKASLFSRSRHHKQRTDSMTFEKRVTWTSHLVRRAIFMVLLPFAGMAYTLASRGPPTHYMVPIIFAGVIGFLSNLAIAECNGIMMETFDTSDLQPGMTGRPRHVLPEEVRKKRTNFSSFPRVTAGFANIQAMSFCIAAAVTGWGGVVERHLGAQVATAVMAGVLFFLTLLLIAALTRYKTVQIIPSQRFGSNVLSGPEDEWKPVIIGNPSGTTRRISLLELGALSRWMEIRRLNRLNAGIEKP